MVISRQNSRRIRRKISRTVTRIFADVVNQRPKLPHRKNPIPPQNPFPSASDVPRILSYPNPLLNPIIPNSFTKFLTRRARIILLILQTLPTPDDASGERVLRLLTKPYFSNFGEPTVSRYWDHPARYRWSGVLSSVGLKWRWRDIKPPFATWLVICQINSLNYENRDHWLSSRFGLVFYYCKTWRSS